MKSVFLFSLFLAYVSAQAIDQAEIRQAWKSAITDIGSNTDLHQKIAKVFTAGILERMQTKMQEIHITTNEVEPTFPTLCILAPLSNISSDAIPLNDAHIVAPPDSEFSGLFNGQLHSCDARLTGLTTIKDCLTILAFPPQLLTIRLGYTIQIGAIGLHGVHAMAMEVLLGLLRLEGLGAFDFEIEDFYLNFEFTLESHWTGMKVTNVTLDLDWSKMNMNTGESSLGGVAINWDYLTSEITEWFKLGWPILREIIQPIIGNVLTGIVEKCYLFDLINGFKCLQPNLLSNAVAETGLNNLFEYDTNADATCETRITNAPVPTTPPREEPVTNNVAGAIELSYLAIFGIVSAIFLINHQRRM